MSVAPFVILVSLSTVIVALVMSEYGNVRRQHFLVSIFVLISASFSLYMIFILPLDISMVCFQSFLTLIYFCLIIFSVKYRRFIRNVIIRLGLSLQLLIFHQIKTQLLSQVKRVQSPDLFHIILQPLHTRLLSSICLDVDTSIARHLKIFFVIFGLLYIGHPRWILWYCDFALNQVILGIFMLFGLQVLMRKEVRNLKKRNSAEVRVLGVGQWAFYVSSRACELVLLIDVNLSASCFSL